MRRLPSASFSSSFVGPSVMSSSFGPSGSEEAKDEVEAEVSGSVLRGADDSFTSDGGTHEQSTAAVNKETTRLLFLIGIFLPL